MKSDLEKRETVTPWVFLCIPLLLLLTAGCSGTKKAASEGRARTQVQAESHARQSENSSRREREAERSAADWSEQLRQALETQTDEDLRLDMKLYDTARPADSATGRPPVLADVTLHRQRQAKTRQSEQTDSRGSSLGETFRESERTDSLRGEWNAHSETRSETRFQESSETTRRTSWWVYGLVLSILAALTVFLRRKFRGRF